MGSAHIDGQFLFRNATLEGSDSMPADRGHAGTRVSGTAMSAFRLTVGAEVALEGSCDVTGGLDLSMSDLSSLSVGPDCSLKAGGRTALDLSNAELRSTLMMGGVTVAGTIRLSGARIHGQLTLTDTRLSQPERSSLIAARGVTVDGDVELHGLRGERREPPVQQRDAGQRGRRPRRAGQPGRGDAEPAPGHRARLGCPGPRLPVLGPGPAQPGHHDRPAGVRQRTFDCPGPNHRNEQGHAIEAISLHARGGMDLGWTRAEPSVDFTNADTTFLADNPARWPSKILISGFTYDRFERPAAVRAAGPGTTWPGRTGWPGRRFTTRAPSSRPPGCSASTATPARPRRS